MYKEFKAPDDRIDSVQRKQKELHDIKKRKNDSKR